MDYHMFSRRGNQRVTTLVNDAVEGWKVGRPQDVIIAQLYQEYLRIELEHPEVSDTHVRETVDEFLQAVGAPEWLIRAAWEAYFYTHSNAVRG